jgi:hypothetical protein
VMTGRIGRGSVRGLDIRLRGWVIVTVKKIVQSNRWTMVPPPPRLHPNPISVLVRRLMASSKLLVLRKSIDVTRLSSFFCVSSQSQDDCAALCL